MTPRRDGPAAVGGRRAAKRWLNGEGMWVMGRFRHRRHFWIAHAGPGVEPPAAGRVTGCVLSVRGAASYGLTWHGGAGSPVPARGEPSRAEPSTCAARAGIVGVLTSAARAAAPAGG